MINKKTGKKGKVGLIIVVEDSDEKPYPENVLGRYNSITKFKEEWEDEQF